MMRIRALAALATGALTLTALAVPAAHADDRPVRPAATGDLDGVVTDFQVNEGKPVVAGLRGKSVRFTFTATLPQGVTDSSVSLWRGPSHSQPERIMHDSYEVSEDEDYPTDSNCRSVSQTTAKCVVEVPATPYDPDRRHALDDAHAGQWNVALSVSRDQDGGASDTSYGTVDIKRAARLSADATPGPVRRGADVTVKGALLRVSWDKQWYAGFAADQVKLQFKKRGGTWKTVRTVAADSRGRVTTKAKATVDGHYRFTYGGSATTGGATSPADFVDVR
ncbi:hypothetical protein JNUCC64_14105 [Streptomyces sp. JNUCC 64]